MRRIADEKRKKAFNLWLKGNTYRHIREKLNISLSAIGNIINEIRQKNPDLDDLRSLNVLIKKNNSDVYEALRGALMCEQLNEIDVNPDELEDFIKLCEKLASEEETETKAFVEAAMCLMILEETYNKSYQEIIEEFKKKHTQNQKLKQKNSELKKQNRQEKKFLEKTKEEINQLQHKLAELIITKNNLKNVSLDRLNELAKFLPTFELLGYSFEEISLFGKIKKQIQKLDINPRKFSKNLENILNINSQINSLEKKRKNLKENVNELETQQKKLKGENPLLYGAGLYVSSNLIGIPCKNCNYLTITQTITLSMFEEMKKGSGYTKISCPNCNHLNNFTVYDYIEQIAKILIPKEI